MKTIPRMTVNSFTLFLLALVFFITSCIPSSEQTSSITRNSCSPPCWLGIDPGKTTRDEATKLLASIPDVNESSIENTSTVEPNDSVKWSWNSEAADFSGRIFSQGDLSTLITIAPKEKMLQFKDVIYKLGEPERILIFRTKGEQAIISIYILYPTKGYGLLNYYITST